MIDQMLQQKRYIDSRVLHLFSCLIMQLTIKYLTVIAWKVKKHNRKSIWLTILLTFRLLVPETVLVISSESGYCWFLLKSCDYSQRTRLTPWFFFLQTKSKNSLYIGLWNWTLKVSKSFQALPKNDEKFYGTPYPYHQKK